MNKYQEVYKIIKRLEDAKEYISKAMYNDLEYADGDDILALEDKVEQLFFDMQNIVIYPNTRETYHKSKGVGIDG